MCGIAGIVAPLRADQCERVVARMNATLVHRGPDDEGTWATDGFGFGMRRLSIIDLEGGHQPMWTPDGVGIVLNGEIYNFLDLRQELMDEGYVFETRSDTEVLLAFYHRHGLAGLSRLQGMFGVCLYDPREGVVHLVRDRLGKKPLYYSFLDGGLLFASEIKAVLAGLSRRPDLNHQALHDYLTMRFVPSGESIWRGIYKLPPAHVLTYRLADQGVDVRRYWNVSFRSAPPDPARNAVAEFEGLFLPAVQKRLLASDVPVGILLSGGLDSSCVAAAALELGHRDLHTFSIGFVDGGGFDERGYAQVVAKHLGTRHHEIEIGLDEFLGFLDDFVWYSDEPLADLASVPLHFVSRLARQHVKVVLSGEGSDEILAGYDFADVAARLARLRRITERVPLPLLRAFGRLPLGRVARIAANLGEGWSRYLEKLGWIISMTFPEGDKRALWGAGPEYFPSDERIRSWFRRANVEEPIDQMLDVYVREWLVEDLLVKADKMSMAASLELRVPFMDHELVQWAASLPLEWKVGSEAVGWQSKRVLREFARKRLPEEIVSRPKQGFPVPAYRWLAHELAGWAREQLLGPGARVPELLRREAVAAILERGIRDGGGQAGYQAWALLVLERWMRRWL